MHAEEATTPRTERSVRDSERRLVEAELLAGFGSWEWDIVANDVTWSAGFSAIAGLEPDRVQDFDGWLATVHPDDRDQALAAVQATVEHDEPYELDCRNVRPDGQVRHVHARGTVVRDADGTPLRMAGTVHDVTEARAAERAARESERRLEKAELLAGIGSWEWDIVANDVTWSAGFDALAGLEPGQVQDFDGWVATVHPDDRDQALAAVQATVEHDEPYELEFRTVRPDGQVRHVHARGSVTRDADGTPLRMAGTVHDVTEARAAERAKQEFTSVVSHELRTPLTSVHAALGLLRSGVLGELTERGRQMVEVAVGSTDRLIRLINDILDIDRLESGQVELRPEATEMEALVEAALLSLEPVAADAGVRLVTDIETCALVADPDRVVQVLTNLISNAIKFSPEGAEVTVTSKLDEEHAWVSVHDEGRGIPAEQLEHVFGRFQQVDASDSRQLGGTGLGLAICRAIVEQHGGTIHAESEGLGHGTTFSFSLPLVQAISEVEAVTAMLPDGQHRATVLVCDDDVEVRSEVAAQLRRAGLDVLEAAGGRECLRLAARHRPAAIVLDLLMPDLDGWQTAAALKRDPQTSDIPIVILSVVARSDEDFEEDVAAWLTKPADPRELFQAIEGSVATDGESGRLLIVEDDEGLGLVLTEVFEGHGLQVEHVLTCEAAIAACQRSTPDALLLDLQLPDGDGLTVVDWLRRNERLSAVPLVVYTARDLSRGEREWLRDATVLTKSRVHPEAVHTHIAELLATVADRTPAGATQGAE